ncbi:MAG: glycosyltransferase family 2 protein [Lentisphaerae bacterium]|jgi:rhamnosyltransferase|nr:glycosyltransferase family 2 protein [Lentisphaerota bacterium]
MKRVVALVITYHPEDSSLESIRLLAEQACPVIIVDNSATSTDWERLTQAFGDNQKSFTLLFNERNLGIASALNRGMRYVQELGAEWVLTMDQDSRITNGMIATMLAGYDTLPADYRLRVASLAPLLTAPSSPPSPTVSDTHCLACREVPTVITSGNLIKIEAWQAVGGYSDKLFIDYVDHDFCFRLRRAGWVILECQDAALIHKIGNATCIRFLGKKIAINQHPPLRTYYITRNGFNFWRTFPDDKTFIKSDKTNTLRLLIKAFFFDTYKLERLKMFWRGYIDFRNNRFGAYVNNHPGRRIRRPDNISQ